MSESRCAVAYNLEIRLSTLYVCPHFCRFCLLPFYFQYHLVLPVFNETFESLAKVMDPGRIYAQSGDDPISRILAGLRLGPITKRLAHQNSCSYG